MAGRIATLALALACLAGPAAQAAVLIDTDFDGFDTGWQMGGSSHLSTADVGGSHGLVLGDFGVGENRSSYNLTPLPLLLSIDLDYHMTSPSSSDPLVIGVHVWASQDDPLGPVSGPLQDHNGYFVVLTGGDAPPQQRLQLQRRSGPNPEDLVVLWDEQWVNDDGLVHHMRITDCGCGRITVYIDDMDLPALYVDDKYNYIGRTGTVLGAGMPGGSAGWIDNVRVEGDPVVPEPMTLLLMALGAVGMIGRNRNRQAHS